MQSLKSFKEAAETGGLFFYLAVWMFWLVVSRQKWMV
jgi:hypothetical protein